jgi:hypothetical protein
MRQLATMRAPVFRSWMRCSFASSLEPHSLKPPKVSRTWPSTMRVVAWASSRTIAIGSRGLAAALSIAIERRDVARQNRHRLAVRDVHRGLAAAQQIVVERGKVVVHEAERVHEFDRDRRGHRVGHRAADRVAGLEDEERTHPFAAREDRVLRRRLQLRREVKARDERVERRVDLGR